jgi:hypothetical protein
MWGNPRAIPPEVLLYFMPTVIPSDGARYFSKGPNDNHAAPALGYLYDSGVVWQPTINGQPGALITGAWRPTVPSDLASTTSIDVSGGLSVNIGAVAITGTADVNITNPRIATSGVIQGGNSIPVNVTGFVTTVVTGTVNSTSSNPVGVTGINTDAATIYATNPAAPYNFVPIGGRVVNPSGAGSVTGSYTTGQFAILNFANNGGVYVNQGILDRTQDEVTVWAAGASTASNDVISGAFGVALSANASRKQWFIQNLATGGLLVRYSTSLPTASAYNMILKGGSNAADGLGASYSDTVYRGPVSVTGQGGASVSYTIWEVA